MNKGSLLNKKSVFFTFWVSYILILVFSIVIITVGYLLPVHILKEKIQGYNMAMLEQAQNVVDERIKSVDQIILDISMNSRINKLMYKNDISTSNDIYEMIEACQDIYRYTNINSSVDNLYVYLKKTDMIINNNSKYEPLLFYNQVIPYDSISFNEWYDLLHKMSIKRCISSSSIKNNEKNVLTILQSIPMNAAYDEDSLGTIGITIEEEQFDKILRNISIINQGTIYIVNPQNIPVVSIGPGNYKLTEKDFSQIYGKGNEYRKINNTKVVISHISSNYNNWRYIFVAPTYIYTNELNRLKNFIAILVTIALLIGTGLAYKLSKKNYSPVKKLVEYIKDNITVVDNDIKNEYVFIKEATASTINENINVKEMIKQQYPLLKNSFLLQLIKGRLKDDISIKKLSESIGIKFLYKYFCIFLINVDEFTSYSKDDSIEGYGILKTIIYNTFNSAMQNEYTIYEVDQYLGKIILLTNINYYDQELYEIRNICHGVRETLISQFSIFISIGIGNIYEGIEGIATSYNEASKALEYKLLKGKSSVIVYKDLNISKERYYYPIDMEMQLLNYIKSGDNKKAEQIVNEIIDNNFKQKLLTIDMARCLFFDIMSTAVKICYEVKVDYSKIFSEGIEPVANLFQCTTIDEMQSTMISIIEKICLFINHNKKSHNDKLKEKIVDFIEKNYTDSNMSLNSLSSVFDITPNYLSKFFKEQTGNNLIDHINRLRINKSKDILLHTVLSLNEVSENIGYTSSSIYIRTFKKFEGSTPGQYRQRYSPNK